VTTFANIIDETALALTGYTNRQDQATYLTSPLSSTATTFTVADGTVLTRGLVEIDDELIWVDSFDRTTNTATVPAYGRGFRDTVATTHTAGTRVTITPSFPRSVIRRNINLAIDAVYPDLFGVYYTTFPFQAAVTTYVLPQEAIDILGASWQTIGPSKEWLPIRHYRVDRMANPLTWNSGKTISIREGIIPGRTVMVTYTKKPATLTYDSDDFSSLTGLPESAREVIVLGAAYRTAMYLDMGRVPAQTAEADSQGQTNPIGSAVNVGRTIQQMYQQRLLIEVRRLQEQYPPRTHYTS
jgi:hypothetical protein